MHHFLAATIRRDVRQQALVPPERLAVCQAIIIGVGAVGRQVALQLAALGMPRLVLFDDDTVQPENLAPQGYRPADLGKAKVDATAQLCTQINPEVQVIACAERFKRSTPREFNFGEQPVIFCCVDSIVTRRIIWESVRSVAAFFVDGRMNAEVLRILAVREPSQDRHYASTLFPADEAYVGACTAQSTIYMASIAAGLMIQQLCRWLRSLTVERDVTLNLLAAELTTS